jgi:hypothetical protein
MPSRGRLPSSDENNESSMGLTAEFAECDCGNIGYPMLSNLGQSHAPPLLSAHSPIQIMKSVHIITALLIASFSGIGAAQAAVIRRESEQPRQSLLQIDPRPSSDGYNEGNAADFDQQAEVMKKKKKKKKKKSKAS